jgi:hypothetical protein
MSAAWLFVIPYFFANALIFSICFFVNFFILSFSFVGLVSSLHAFSIACSMPQIKNAIKPQKTARDRNKTHRKQAEPISQKQE